MFSCCCITFSLISYNFYSRITWFFLWYCIWFWFYKPTKQIFAFIKDFYTIPTKHHVPTLQTDPNDPNGPELDVKIEDLKQNIRKAETSKQKAEARIECLRAGGVNVDEWLKEAETLTVQDIQRSASSLSVRTDVGVRNK